ncbi:hypothetical protein HK098_000319 [Nowakowskiella sp. JEL0407]|nr:hypothetical protein HK098_000319 [Nowakowskiella sp. JEL0407]
MLTEPSLNHKKQSTNHCVNSLLSKISTLERRCDVSNNVINSLRSKLKDSTASISSLEREKKELLDKNKKSTKGYNQCDAENKQNEIHELKRKIELPLISLTESLKEITQIGIDLPLDITGVVNAVKSLTSKCSNLELRLTEVNNNYQDLESINLDLRSQLQDERGRLLLERHEFEQCIAQKDLEIQKLTEQLRAKFQSNEQIAVSCADEKSESLERLLGTAVGEVTSLQAQLNDQLCINRQQQMTLLEYENQLRSTLNEINTHQQHISKTATVANQIEIGLKDSLAEEKQRNVDLSLRENKNNEIIMKMSEIVKKRGFFGGSLDDDVHRLVNNAHWVPNASSKCCQVDGCGRSFGLFTRKHHCRKCGKLICAKHLKCNVKLTIAGCELSSDGIPTKVCVSCCDERQDISILTSETDLDTVMSD